MRRPNQWNIQANHTRHLDTVAEERSEFYIEAIAQEKEVLPGLAMEIGCCGSLLDGCRCFLEPAVEFWCARCESDDLLWLLRVRLLWCCGWVCNGRKVILSLDFKISKSKIEEKKKPLTLFEKIYTIPYTMVIIMNRQKGKRNFQKVMDIINRDESNFGNSDSTYVVI